MTGKKQKRQVRAVSLGDTAESIDYICDYFQKRNIKTVFITEVMTDPETAYMNEAVAISEYLTKKSGERGVYYFNAGDYLRSFPPGEVFTDQLHFSRKGAELFASFISRKLTEYNLVE